MESHTFAITIRSDRLFETSFATSMGVVSQLVPLRSEPSGITIKISSRGWAETVIRMIDLEIDDMHTFHKFTVFCVQFFEQLDAMIKKTCPWLELLIKLVKSLNICEDRSLQVDTGMLPPPLCPSSLLVSLHFQRAVRRGQQAAKKTRLE